MEVFKVKCIISDIRELYCVKEFFFLRISISLFFVKLFFCDEIGCIFILKDE